MIWDRPAKCCIVRESKESIMKLTTHLGNLVEQTIDYKMQETLIFTGDRAPITLETKYIKRGLSCPMSSNIEYRSEFYNKFTSSYTWSWFDHYDDLVAISYTIETVD